MLTLKDMIAARSQLRGGRVPAVNWKGVQKVVALPVGNFIAMQAEFGILSGSGEGRSSYLTMIVFHDLAISDVADKLFDVKVEESPGNITYMQRPSLSQTPVKVTCTCDDFYWTWQYFVDQRGGLAGAKFPTPSAVTGSPVRKTDGGEYGSPLQLHGVGISGRTQVRNIPRNPKHAPGLCKHLVYFAKFVIQQKWVTIGTAYTPDNARLNRQSRLR